jgi:hypothetical protein
VVDSANAKLGKIMVLFGALPAYRIIHIKTLQHTEKLLTCQFVQLLEGQAGKAHGSGQGLMPATPLGTCTHCAAPPTAQSQLQTRNCACCPPRSRTTQQRACSRHGRRQMRSGCAYEAYIRLRQSTTGRSCMVDNSPGSAPAAADQATPSMHVLLHLTPVACRQGSVHSARQHARLSHAVQPSHKHTGAGLLRAFSCLQAACWHRPHWPCRHTPPVPLACTARRAMQPKLTEVSSQSPASF